MYPFHLPAKKKMHRQMVPVQLVIRMLICAGMLLLGALHAGANDVIRRAGSLFGAAREDFLIAGAKIEGQVVSYTTSSHQLTQPMVDLFESKYPFISVKVARTGGSKIIQKVATEARAGSHVVDVIGTGETGIVALVDKGLIAKYASPLCGHLRDGFCDKAGLWTVQHAGLIFSAYNKTVLQGRSVPQKWEDFLDPKWKGKMSLDTSAYGWAQSMIDHRGEPNAIEYFKQLAKQDVTMLRGRSLQLQLLAAGEFALTLVSNANLVMDLKKAGAPIEPIRISPVFLRPNMLLMAANAPHPHAAILYLDFLLSKEAQALLANSGRLPSRRDVTPSDTVIYDGLQFFMSDPLESGRNYSRLADLYQEILLGQ